MSVGEFEYLPLGEVASVTSGYAFKSRDWTDDGIPVVKIANVKAGTLDMSGCSYVAETTAAGAADFRLRAGDILISMTGYVGRVAVVRENNIPSILNQRVGRFSLVDRTRLDRRFFYYCVSDPSFSAKVEALGYGSAQPNVSPTAILGIEVPLPEVEEQCRIACLLGAIDDKIELNQRMNETLEAMARAIFKDWFVDFGPTRAKAEGRAPYLAPELWDLFPDALDNEDKPVGWGSKPLDETAEFLNGLALQKFPASDPDDSLPVIKIAELRGGIAPKSSRASREVPEKYVVADGDFLFSWSGSLLAKFWTEGEGALNQHLFKVTSGRYPPWFLSQWVHHHLEEFRAIAASKATTMGHIQRRHLKEAETMCPPDDVLSILGQTVGPLVERTIKNDLEARTLAQTRDLLLPKLMSGEIRLREAEEAVEAVA